MFQTGHAGRDPTAYYALRTELAAKWTELEQLRDELARLEAGTKQRWSSNANGNGNENGRSDLPFRTLSVTEAAYRLGMSYARTRDLLLRGKLRGGLVGKRWRIEEASVVEYQRQLL